MQAHVDPSRALVPATACVHTLFEREVENTPESIALVHGSETVTYFELNQKANRIAHYLISEGIGQETLVGIALERSPDLIACVLGVLKAGGAYLPIDAGYPRERLAMILEDGHPPLVLADSPLSKRLPLNSSRTVCLDDIGLDGQNSENPEISSDPSHLAYVMFTSGSTGRPKGVMIEHRSIVRLVKDTDYADFSAKNVFLQFAPTTFDASTFEIWGALLNGATLAIMPAGLSSLADLGKAIREYGVTTLWLTAGLFHLMVDERIDDLRPLRQLLAGGDVLSVTHVQKVLNELECDVINGYGPTENTTFTCTYQIPRNAEIANSIPIGKPISNTQVILLDEDLRPVHEGEVGELCIGGIGLARGYLNCAEMTTEKFVPNPFPDISSSNLYRSGDLARYRPDGNIEFLGRSDKQVKIRGFRIELEEIEIALTRQSGIREAAVIVKELSESKKQLVAYVVSDPNSATEICRLRNRLAETLPEYMIPSLILPIDALPLTPNGKVDRAELINTIDKVSKQAPLLIEPEDERELKIAGLLEEVLGRGQVGRNDNFFDLGADSLQIAQFHSRLQAAFDPEIKIVSLFQHPTVSALALNLDNKVLSEAGSGESRERAIRQRNAFIRQRRMLNKGVRS